MQWTRERTTWLGTGLQKSGRWHGLPYTVRGLSTKGMTRQGRIVVILAAVIVLAILVATELFL